MDREVELREPRQSFREAVDGVVLRRLRAVAALVGDFEPVALEQFLGGLQVDPARLAVLERDAAAFVQRELGVDEIAMVLDEVVDAVLVPVGDLLVRGQREDQVAIGLVAFLLVADQRRDERRGHELVIARAAAVEVAVLLHELVRVGGPVRAQRFHHVDVGEQQDRLALARAVQACDQVAALRRCLERLHVRVGEARGLQTCGHRLRRFVRVAHRLRRVDLHQLLVDVARELLLPRQLAVGRRGLRADQQYCAGDAKALQANGAIDPSTSGHRNLRKSDAGSVPNFQPCATLR